jgi:hypothetical protein
MKGMLKSGDYTSLRRLFAYLTILVAWHQPVDEVVWILHHHSAQFKTCAASHRIQSLWMTF